MNGYVNFDDVIGQLVEAGFGEPKNGWSSAIDCGKTGVRCKVEGTRQGGAVALHTLRLDDGRTALVGAGWYYVAAEKFVVKLELRIDAKPVKLSTEARDAMRARQREIEKAADAAQKQKNDKAARQAMHTWAKLATEGQSAYLTKKGVGAFGVKFSPSGAMVIPMTDTHGRIHGLQVIRPDKKNGRDKDFWPAGLAKKGHFHIVGTIRGTAGEIVLVAEGYATAGSLHMATGLPVVVAFDAGNLGPVAAAIHAKYKKARLLFCADDDYLTDGNPGAKHASNAALATGGAWVVPAFAVDRAGEKITDFNDLHAREGIGAVRAQVEQKLATLGWEVSAPAAPRAGAAPEGGGGKRRSAQSVMALDDLVHRFIPLDDGKGKLVFDTWTNRPAMKEQMISLLPAGVRGDDIKRHPLWVERGAHYLEQVGFDPAGENSDITLNMWSGWPTTPKKGSCERLRDLLRHQCSGEPAVAEQLLRWVECWLAYPIQHPGAKMQTAVIMHGPQGTGKGRFFEWGYMPIFGRYGVYLDQDALEDKHGSDWQSCRLFVLADEVLARAEMYHHKNKLKNLVTSRRIRINPKGLVAYEEDNHLNIVFLSNEKQPLVLENDDRRYCVIWTPPPLTAAFYDELSEEINTGGVEALHHYLKHEVDLGDFRPWTRPPMTEAKRDLINLGRDSIDRFMIDWQHGDTEHPFCPCGSADLYRAYFNWCRTNGERAPRPENHFSGHLVKMAGWKKAHKDIRFEGDYGHTEVKRQRMVIPSDDAMNEAASRSGAEDLRHQPGQSITEWMTLCFFTFRKSLQAAS